MHEIGQPFIPATNISLEWRAGRLPTEVVLYKAVSNGFSHGAISHVMGLGGWKMSDRTRVPDRAPAPEDKHILHFGRTGEAKQLSVYPPAGIIAYRDQSARAAMGHRAEDVPTEQGAVELARQVLKKLGLDEHDFVKNSNGTLRVYRAQRTRGSQGTKQVISRDVHLVRQVNGIAFHGTGVHGGVLLAFGDHGRIAELSVVWPALKPLSTNIISSPGEIMERVKRGKARMPFGPAAQKIVGNENLIRSISVDAAAPTYLGFAMDDPKDLIIPFLSLEVTVSFPTTNYQAVLNCPLTTTMSETK
jgi:hypothetical protein